jgi:signal transduction histidine kinase
VVHGIVEEHGGEMNIRTSPWGGAEFEVLIPLHGPDAEKENDIPYDG